MKNQTERRDRDRERKAGKKATGLRLQVEREKVKNQKPVLSPSASLRINSVEGAKGKRQK
jgi:hypothetical protein